MCVRQASVRLQLSHKWHNLRQRQSISPAQAAVRDAW